jgi:hypothetical protein
MHNAGMKRFTPYIWLPIVAATLIAAFYFIFVSGPVLTCFCGIVIAATLFWVRERHQIFYGVTEVVAGLFVLAGGYSNGRGAFTSGFAEAFQQFQWSVVVISTLGAVYIMIRGFDNIKRGLSPPSPKP